MSFTRNQPSKYGKELLDTARKTWLDAAKTALVHKTAEAFSKLIENKVNEKTVKPKPVRDENFLRNVEEIVIPPDQRQEILNELRQIL